MAQGIGDNGAARGNRWSLAIWGGAALLLALPAVAMRFTTEVDWGPEDFITMGILLAAACGGYEVATRISGNTAYRAAVAVAGLSGALESSDLPAASAPAGWADAADRSAGSSGP